MFGGQDDNGSAPQNGGGGGSSQDDTLNGVTDLVGGAAEPTASAPDAGSTPAPSSSSFLATASEPEQSSTPAPHEEAEDVVAPSPSTPAPGTDTSGLLDLKQQALQQLTPLVGHLEQTPLEKFRTTMMLIQASDNQSLLKEAYEAAQAIEDEKVKAQALLDVVNEINYFTQNPDDSSDR